MVRGKAGHQIGSDTKAAEAAGNDHKLNSRNDSQRTVNVRDMNAGKDDEM